jgi:hypothetical protein
MPEDRNALLGVLAVKRGWAQPAEVIAAQMAAKARPGRTLAAELAASGALSREREKELEAAADRALAQAAGNVRKAIAANGGLEVLSPPAAGKDLFIDDESTVLRGPARGGGLADDDDERTTIKK